MIPFGEFAPDLSSLNKNVASTAKNVLPLSDYYGPMYQFSAVSDALDNPCKGAFTARDSDGNQYIFSGDKTKLYRVIAGTSTDSSKVGNYTDNSEYWSFVQWNEQIVALKYGDTPQVLTMGGTTFADLGGTPPQARTGAVVRSFLVLGNTWDSGDDAVSNRVRWSAFNDITGWTAGTNQSDQQDIAGNGGEVMKIVGGEYGIIFQRHSIQRMTYVGEPLIFEFDEIEPRRGTPAPMSVVQNGSDIFYLSEDGFYVLQNGTTSTPIGHNKVDRWFYSDLNESFIGDITSSIDPERGLVYWGYASTESTSGNDSLIIYNFKTGRWSYARVNTQYIFRGSTTAYTLEELDAFGTLDTLEVSLDSAAWQGGAYKLGVYDTNNKLGFFSGSELSGELETGEINNGVRRAFLRSVLPHIDGDSTVTITHKNRYLDSLTTSPAVSLDATGKANMRISSRYIRVKCTTSGEFTRALGVEADIEQEGAR